MISINSWTANTVNRFVVANNDNTDRINYIIRCHYGYFRFNSMHMIPCSLRFISIAKRTIIYSSKQIESPFLKAHMHCNGTNHISLAACESTISTHRNRKSTETEIETKTEIKLKCSNIYKPSSSRFQYTSKSPAKHLSAETWFRQKAIATGKINKQTEATETPFNCSMWLCAASTAF